MSSSTDIPSLESLDFLPYIDDAGELPIQLQNKIGIYAIFDESQVLQFVGYSRDIYLSLKQHLIRKPESCYWVKATTIDRPNRTFLENVQSSWTTENGSIPIGNGADSTQWLDPISTHHAMTAAESDSFADLDGVAQIKLLKQVSRRVEENILATLQQRGVHTEIRFNPKLKEQGLLDLK
ncbi:GIY-YIG nuclease family protein [Chamaesiphon polymorphus]|uniref:Nuclease subunit of the excinuclease complex n=1 Tax=Chamaesiphon polymorphus CCALA 037 TaxID=2107692 RepID=A0A2T1GEE2_9CYAN|nr:GIY-YIG nuclease family protein [Chamaesiphon polymorphus]PSB55802.1 Nuclease subunit of the excinuclease complex [Chamaesiphon polymorphus CCALA 037]